MCAEEFILNDNNKRNKYAFIECIKRTVLEFIL